MNTAKQIDEIMFELEEQGLIPMMNGEFNFINETRSYFGEERFLVFLKTMVRIWDINIESK